MLSFARRAIARWAQSKSRGFTLIEMSIVLVIIGLIIGGILKGQEIIASARQKAVINEVNAVKAATNTYFDRYRALPGDDPSAATNLDPNVTNGNGDGVVGTTQATTNAILTANVSAAAENYNFFNGLIAAGLLNGGAETNGIPGANVNFGTTAFPGSPITGAGVTEVDGTHTGDTSAGTVRNAHWLRLHKNLSAPAAAVSPRTLANIDVQIDDGLPYAGGVRDLIAAAPCETAAAGVAVGYAASDNIACVPVFEISQ